MKKRPYISSVGTVRIRLAEPTDLEALHPLFEAYRFHFTHQADPQRGKLFLEQRLARSDSVIFVACPESIVCGFVQLFPLFSSWYARPLLFLSDLFVAPDVRKRGIAKALIENVHDYLIDTGAISVIVEIPFSEPNLVRFYEKAGYRKDHIFQLYRLAGTAGDPVENEAPKNDSEYAGD
ncbi:MAG: GNAT family N-acetyltransferase [Candidatus Eremiobacteraeota bacterium]|nr:GNAT family N-acetyltransferase [Candidatus Eremiobacteraeota bacterium]